MIKDIIFTIKINFIILKKKRVLNINKKIYVLNKYKNQ